MIVQSNGRAKSGKRGGKRWLASIFLSGMLCVAGGASVFATDAGPGFAASGLTGNLAYNKPAVASDVISSPNNLVLSKPVAVSNYHSTSYSGEKAVDGDPGTRWATQDQTQTATLDIDFGTDTTFDKIVFSQLQQRIGSYKIQYWKDNKWQDAYSGGKADSDESALFPPVTGSKVRFNITSTINGPGGPSIWEFEVYNTKVSAPNPVHDGSKAVDADPGTRWATGDNTQNATLDVDLGAMMTFDRVEFTQLEQRIGSYKIQYWNGTSWADAYEGGAAASREQAAFQPVTGSKVRLNITSSTHGPGGPSIWEFEVYNTQAQAGLSRASRVLIDKGLQQQAWITTDETGRRFPTADEWKNIHFTAPTYYEVPMYNATFQNALPDSQWSLAKAPFAEHMDSGPTTDDDFLNEQQRANISNLVSMQFGDEESFGVSVVKTLKEWYDLSHKLYPDALVHNNQWGGQWSTDQLRSYVRAAKPDLLTYDSYYFSAPGQYAGGSVKSLYEQLNKYRTVALEGIDGTGQAPIAFGLYTQGFKEGSGTYVPSESEIDIVSSATWTMGGKWTNLFRWEEGPVFLFYDENGNLTPTYDQYAKLAREGNNLGPYLVRLNSTDVRFIPGKHQTSGGSAANALPNTVAAWDASADPYVKSVQVANVGTANAGLPGDVLIGYFKPLHGLTAQDLALLPSPDAKAFMILNGLTGSGGNGSRSATSQKITLNVDTGNVPVQLMRVNRDTGGIEPVDMIRVSGSQYTAEVVLGGGTADLFFWVPTNVNPPVTTDDAAEGWQNSDQTVHLHATDSGAGLQATYYSLDGAPYAEGNTIHVTDEGVHTLSYYSVDKAGNKEAVKTIEVKIDKTAPEVVPTDSMHAYLTDAIRLGFDVKDALSGVASSSVKLDHEDVANPVVFEPLSLSLGDHTVDVTAADQAGNVTVQSFKLHVSMDAQHVKDLLKLGKDQGSIHNDGVYTSLLAKTDRSQWKALENETRAQSGKHIESGFAKLLLSAALYLQNSSPKTN